MCSAEAGLVQHERYIVYECCKGVMLATYMSCERATPVVKTC